MGPPGRGQTARSLRSHAVAREQIAVRNAPGNEEHHRHERHHSGRVLAWPRRKPHANPMAASRRLPTIAKSQNRARGRSRAVRKKFATMWVRHVMAHKTTSNGAIARASAPRVGAVRPTAELLRSPTKTQRQPSPRPRVARHDPSGKQDAPVIGSVLRDPQANEVEIASERLEHERPEHPEVVSPAFPSRCASTAFQSEVRGVQLPEHAHRPGLVRMIGSVRQPRPWEGPQARPRSRSKRASANRIRGEKPRRPAVQSRGARQPQPAPGLRPAPASSGGGAHRALASATS